MFKIHPFYSKLAKFTASGVWALKFGEELEEK